MGVVLHGGGDDGWRGADVGDLSRAKALSGDRRDNVYSIYRCVGVTDEVVHR
jgi:hypothetical protein